MLKETYLSIYELRELIECEAKPVFNRLAEQAESARLKREAAIQDAFELESQRNQPTINQYSKNLRRQGDIADMLIARKGKTDARLEVLRKEKDDKEVTHIFSLFLSFY
jgi:hypothetical protein